MTETQDQTLPGTGRPSTDAPVTNGAADGAATTRAAAKKGSLSTKLLPELQQIAGGLGINTTKMKKSDLVAAIRAAQGGSGAPAGAQSSAGAPAADAPSRRRTRPAVETSTTDGAAANGAAAATTDTATSAAPTSTSDAPASSRADVSTDDERGGQRDRSRQRADRQNGDRNQNDDRSQGTERNQNDRNQNDRNNDGGDNQGERTRNDRNQNDRNNGGGQNGNNRNDGGQQNDRNQNDRNQNDRNSGGGNQNGRHNDGRNQNDSGNGNRNQNDRNNNDRNNNRDDDDDFEGGGRRRGRRYRDRNRNRNRDRQGGGHQDGGDREPTVSDDDVLVPVAGIVDCIEDKNNWFIRVEGYFAGPDDVFVATSFVRRFNLRRGDAVTGSVRQPKDGERREKYNPLVRLDTVNGSPAEQGVKRPDFTRLTPLYPQERLRLETEPNVLTTRVIDLVMPIGKGQRALIASPPKAGKTMVLQAIANAIATNNPEVHLMVVLVDERPEEVTDMQRSVKGEVIASTFDRKPSDHTMVAELSIERAKRLVEMGHDVVVLLDSITRLGRAYNLAAPASGRILSGGVDSTALYPPKRFLGAARNIENGGSLTILATALVETGSAGDSVIFEEFKGTGNAELKLDRKIADKRIFPAIDVDQSSTRKEELLLSPDELGVTIKLRRVLGALESQQALDLLLDRLRKTRTNFEFLMQIAKNTPGQDAPNER